MVSISDQPQLHICRKLSTCEVENEGKKSLTEFCTTAVAAAGRGLFLNWDLECGLEGCRLPLTTLGLRIQAEDLSLLTVLL